MDRELLTIMLASREELSAEGTTFSVNDGATCELLIASRAGGPAPLPKISSLSLEEAFVVAVGEEGTYCLPYELVCGIKLRNSKAEAKAGRTGFHR